MRIRVGLVIILVVVSGCNGIPGAMEDTPVQTDDSGGSNGEGGNSSTSTATKTEEKRSTGPVGATATMDVIGSENGYWHNATLRIDPADGLNVTEHDALVARTMARVEKIRQLEFEYDVSVTTITQSEYNEEANSAAFPTSLSESARQFINTRFEAMFLIGEQTDAVSMSQGQEQTAYAGFYKDDSILIITDGAALRRTDEETLAHELGHALVDQHFDLSQYGGTTTDSSKGVNGLIEGDAQAVEFEYADRCGGKWQCLPKNQTDTGNVSNYGLSMLSYFEYDEGPAFINHYRQKGGWKRVNELYSNPPTSAEQVISPERSESDRPAELRLSDRTKNGWTRADPYYGPDYETIGQSGIAAMFAQSAFENGGGRGVVSPLAVLNRNFQGMNMTDPYNYDLASSQGWDGDRLHIYEKSGESAYVWKTRWDSKRDAAEFATAYRTLLSQYGGSKTDPFSNRWVIENGTYADAFSVSVDGKTVTIVNAPSAAAISDVRAD